MPARRQARRRDRAAAWIAREGAPEVAGSHLLVGDRPAAQHRRSRPRPRRREDQTSAATSRSTTSCGPTCPASGRWATATAAAPSPIPRRTTTRSSRPTFSTASSAASATASPAYALYIDPPLGPRRHDRGGGPQERPPRAGRPASRWRTSRRAYREGRDRGLHEDPGRRRDRSRSWAPRSSAPSGDEAIHCVLDTMYAKAPYTVLQRAMHIHPTVAEFIPTILGDLLPLQDDRS